MVLKDTIANSIISLEEAISNIQPGGLISPNSGSIVTIEDVAEPGIGGEINLTTEIDEGVTHNPYAKIRLLSQKSSSSSPRGTEFSVDLKANDTEGTPTVRFIMQNAYYGTTSVYAGISGTPLDVEEPIAPTNAATKGYVDNFVPDRIKGGAGTTYDETQLGVGPDATGAFSRLLRGVNRGDVFLEQLARENSDGSGHIGWRNTRSGYGRGYVEWSSSRAEIYGSHSAGNYGKVRVDGIAGGNVYFDFPGANSGGGYESSSGGMRLASHSSHTPNVRALPSHVNSILHGIKLGVDAHDALANYEWSEYPAVQNVGMAGHKLTGLAEPTNPQDAATKAYVDANSGGGSGPPSKIESPSGNTSVESIDFSSEEAGTIMKATRGDSESVIAVTVAEDEIDPLETQSEVIIGVHNPNGPDGAWFEAKYLTRDNRFELAAGGAPLNIEEPVEGHHAATKAYVDSQSGGGDSSLLTSDDANTFITASNDSLITGFDQYSKKLVVEELSPEDPGIMLSKSIETWDDIAHDEAIWGSVDGLGKAFLRTNYAFVEDSNDKSWGFQWINNVFEEYSHHGINITQGDHRLTFATVDTSSGDFYLASETLSDSVNRWSQIDIRKNNIEIRAAEYGISDSNNATSFKIEPNGSSTNKPLNMGNNRITNVEDPTNPQDVATKAYVDANSGGGKHWGVFEGNNLNLPGMSGNPLSPEDRARLSVGDIAMLVHPSIPSQTSIFYCAANPPAPASPQWRKVMTQASDGTARFDLGGTKLTGLPVSVDSSDAVRRQELVFWPQSVSAGGHHLNSLADPLYAHQAATKGYVDSRFAVEWWEPTWTPVANVSGVSNIECQYTRTYRAAGGSLVTLEGTIEVTPSGADTMTMVSVDLPVPRDGVDTIAGIAFFTDYDGDDFGLARVGVADLGAGQQVSVQYTPSTNAVHRVSFRVSYRAA